MKQLIKIFYLNNKNKPFIVLINCLQEICIKLFVIFDPVNKYKPHQTKFNLLKFDLFIYYFQIKKENLINSPGFQTRNISFNISNVLHCLLSKFHY